MDRLETMRVFVAIAEEGGFAPAARKLESSPPAVTRAIAALEARIGTQLLVRTTRIVRLTDAGTRFLGECKRILAELDEAEAIAAGEHAEVRGVLTVTASTLFGKKHVSPILFEFLDRHPLVDARALLVDRVVDLVDEGLDVAVRVGVLPDTSLTAVRVGGLSRVVCASPAYLAAHGTPRKPEDLVRHRALAFTGMPNREWDFADGTTHTPSRPQIRFISNTADVAIGAAMHGHGLTRVLSYMVESELREGTLVRVLAEYEPAPIPVHVLHVGGRSPTARVRAFVDLAVTRLRASPALS